ncbi:MAG: alpha/beta hydrolase, partial [Bacteroidales bacterium]|nr:alpha/beta hydrolase [Bacteroidales bacterium]
MCASATQLSVTDFTTPKYEVSVERDVVYARVEGYWSHAPVGKRGTFFHVAPLLRETRPLDLDMDIYLPADDGKTGRPLLLMMHGGSFFVGNKEEKGQAGWCEYFASLGYVAASINYRLGFRPFRQDVAAAETRALEDADAALRYLLDREDLRIDPELLFAAGTSAGAITALNLAFRPAGDHPRIRAVGNYWGSVHDLKVLENARTAILSFQSVHDPVMPYGEGYPFRTGDRRFQPPV